MIHLPETKSVPKLPSMLGFCSKAGKLTAGTEACIKAVKSGKARLALASFDASDNTRRQYARLCAEAGVKLLEVRGDIGHMAGRRGCKLLAVTDRQFAEAIERAYASGKTKQEEYDNEI